DAAELAVGRRVEVVGRGLDRQRDAEVLVAALVLAHGELRLAQRALEGREQVRDRLGVVPDVRAGPRALRVVLVASLPAPEAAVGLAQHGRRLEYAQVGG